MPIFTKSVQNEQYVSLRDRFMSSLTADEYFALEAYTSSSYNPVNKAMISGEINTPYQSLISTIKNALGKQQDDEILPVLFRGTQQEHISHLVEGQEVTFPFFMSASTDPLVAGRFAGEQGNPAVIVIKNLNKHYAPVSVSQLNEYEVLISPDAKFRVEKITHGTDYQAEYDQSGYHAPIKKNVTVVEVSAI